jgi:O-antigen/teichoic acid export membrane protein
MAMPVVFLPGLFVFPISTLLLPEVAASRAHGRQADLRRRLKQMTLLTLGMTLAGSVAMLLLAHRISTMLYRTDEAAALIERYAPAVPLLYIGYVLRSALNGLGRARLVLASTAAGALVDFAVLYNTVSRPSINIYGAIMGDVAGFALAAAINAIGLGLYLAKGGSNRRR